MKNSFYYSHNRLHCENIDLLSFASEHNTPFYLYSKQEIVRNCQQVLKAGEHVDFLSCFALKANYNPALLRIIRDLGFGADVVSGGELTFALKLGFSPDKIVFAGVGKTESEIEFAIRENIHSINVESEQEYDTVAEIANKLETPVRIAVRVTPDIDAQTHSYISTGKHINKFGVAPHKALTIYNKALSDPYVVPAGVHIHIGSQIVTPEPFKEAVRFLRSFTEQLTNLGVTLQFLDLGGGIGINYSNDFRSQQQSTYINDILPFYLDGLKDLNLRMVAELGRSIIGSAGILVTKALYQKDTGVKQFLIVDAAMNNLIRPSLYQAHHEIVPLLLDERPHKVVDVVGPVCETGDFLAKDRELPDIQPGEYLAVTGAGAYGQALSSNYNLRPRITEYLVDGGEVRTIYKGQTIEDIFQEFEN